MKDSKDMSLWERQKLIAQAKKIAWNRAAPNWEAQTGMFKYGLKPNERKPRQIRKDDIDTWLIRHSIPSTEKVNVRLCNSFKPCPTCGSRYFFRHRDIGTVRCWKCTRERSDW